MTLVAGCAHAHLPYAHLSAAQAKQCRADGGYESRGGFGEPICQVRYADGGKPCLNKSDCLGRCISDAPDGDMRAVAAGTPVSGHCAAEKEIFGCYANVEDGKLVEGYFCDD